MKRTTQTLVLALISLALPTASFAEEEGFTVHGGLGFFDFDSSRLLSKELLWDIGVGYRFDSPLGVEFSYIGSDPNGMDTNPDAETDQWRLDGLYHFGIDSDYIEPFLSAGIGHRTYDYFGAGEFDETAFNVGVGAKYWMSDRMAFRTDFKIFRGKRSNDNDLALTFGLHYAIGQIKGDHISAPAEPQASAPAPRPMDSDRDGVMDDADACPGTQANIPVNSQGCPRDRDGDGVADYQDSCPGTTNRAASIDDRGCYVRLEETVSIELNVQFDLDSADTKSAHRAEVEQVYNFMNEYPDTRVTIEGHTDDSGDAEYNEGLSQRRADAIASMLIDDFGIAASRVRAVGYGEERPIASNATADGRAQNRRVIGVVEATVEKIERR